MPVTGVPPGWSDPPVYPTPRPTLPSWAIGSPFSGWVATAPPQIPTALAGMLLMSMIGARRTAVDGTVYRVLLRPNGLGVLLKMPAATVASYGSPAEAALAAAADAAGHGGFVSSEP